MEGQRKGPKKKHLPHPIQTSNALVLRSAHLGLLLTRLIRLAAWSNIPVDMRLPVMVFGFLRSCEYLAADSAYAVSRGEMLFSHVSGE